MDANILKKTGKTGLSAARAANALQVLNIAPELSALVESWNSLADAAKVAILRLASSAHVGGDK